MILDPDTATTPGWVRETHLVCCRPRRGLCGTAVSTDLPDATAVTCPTCDLIDESGAPCGALFCRLRQWLRQHLGRTR